MCNQACVSFAEKYLNSEIIKDKEVLEVGALIINGGIRPIVEGLNPRKYIGCDILEGNGVDDICSVYDIVSKYGKESFDLVINTEMLEHVKHWRKAINNLKNVVKENGYILITTRSKGFSKHCFPSDYWRYEIEDMKEIFLDFNVISIEPDLTQPGVFVFAQRNQSINEQNLESINLYNIERGIRC